MGTRCFDRWVTRRGGFRPLAWAALAVLALWAGAARGDLPKDVRERVSPHFVFYHGPDKVGEVEAVVIAAEDAYRNIADRLLFRPVERIPVIIYSRRADFRKATEVGGMEFVVGTASSGDHTIRLDGSDLLDKPARVVGHEVAHIFLFRMLGDRIGNLPLWVNEGLAQQLGGADPRRARNVVEDALTAGDLPPLPSLASEFPRDEEAGIAYSQAQYAVGALLERGGWESMRTLLESLRQGMAFDAAMQAAYDETPEQWERDWLWHVRAEARRHAWMQIASWVVPALMFIALGWGTLTVRRHRRKQIEDEMEPEPDLEPPSWWREDEFRL